MFAAMTGAITTAWSMTDAAAAARAILLNHQRVPKRSPTTAVNPAAHARPKPEYLDPANRSG
jgi:hypothetical protein